MDENDKTRVSFDRFITLMNEELHHHPRYREGMRFINIETGYGLVFPDGAQESPLVKASIDKEILDQISSRYTITQ